MGISITQNNFSVSHYQCVIGQTYFKLTNNLQLDSRFSFIFFVKSHKNLKIFEKWLYPRSAQTTMPPVRLSSTSRSTWSCMPAMSTCPWLRTSTAMMLHYTDLPNASVRILMKNASMLKSSSTTKICVEDVWYSKTFKNPIPMTGHLLWML